MLNSKKVKKSGQNYIRKFCQRNNIKLFYDCECGKRYDAFPALYLHFQRKHGKKISTKHQYNDYQVQEKNNSIVLKYILKKNEYDLDDQENQFSYYRVSPIKIMMESFKVFIVRQIEPEKVAKSLEILKILGEQMEIIFKYSTGVSEEKFIGDIPIFFNNFIFQIMGKKVQLKYYSLLCKIILKLGQWLKQNKYTLVQTQYIGFNGEFSLENQQV